MTDLLAGGTVKALDHPPAVWDQDTTAITNPTNTSYSAGSPEVGVVFTAPTSGRVYLIVGGGVGNSAAGDRIFLSPQVFEGTSSAGTQILSPTVVSRGYSSIYGSAASHYGSRRTVLDGLTPGQQYYARVMHVVATDPGTQTCDIACRDITVAPAP